MDSNALDTCPLHRCSFQWTGIDTIGMDTNPFVAGVVDAAVDVITRYDRGSRQAGGRGNSFQRAVLRPAVGRRTTLNIASYARPFAAR